MCLNTNYPVGKALQVGKKVQVCIEGMGAVEAEVISVGLDCYLLKIFGYDINNNLDIFYEWVSWGWIAQDD